MNLIDTFNNLIPSHLMKFLNWQDDEVLDAEYPDVERPYSDEEEEVDEDVQDFEDLPEDKNLLFNN